MSHPFPMLHSLFPSSEHSLDVDEQLQVLSLVTLSATGKPRLSVQRQFTHNEWRILMSLLEAYPIYVPYAHLLAQVTPFSQEECQARLKVARQQGNDEVKRELRPVRDALVLMHSRLADLSLTVASVQRLGYLLAVLE